MKLPRIGEKILDEIRAVSPDGLLPSEIAKKIGMDQLSVWTAGEFMAANNLLRIDDGMKFFYLDPVNPEGEHVSTLRNASSVRNPHVPTALKSDKLESQPIFDYDPPTGKLVKLVEPEVSRIPDFDRPRPFRGGTDY